MKPILLALLYISTIVQNGSTTVEDTVTIYVTDFAKRQIVKLVVYDSSTAEWNIITTGQPQGIDYSHVGKQIYWVEQSPPSIKRADINLKNVAIIANLPSTADPRYLAIEEDSRKLFYTDFGRHEIVSMSLTGSRPTTILNSKSVMFPVRIIIHSSKRLIIWSDAGSDERISSANYDGSNIRRIVNISTSYGLAVDEKENTLYWSEMFTGLIQSVSLDGSNRRTIYRHAMYIVDLFLLGKTLFYTAMGKQVHRVSVNGSNADEIFSVSRFSLAEGLYVLSDRPRACPDGTFGSNCSSCGARHCQGESDCPADGACSQGCQNGYRGPTCTQDCEPGFYGSDCSLSCTDRKCVVDSSNCFHVTGQCIGGCKPGFKSPDCSQKCGSGLYGSACSLSCTDRKCLDSSSGCDHMTGQCVGGCQPGYSGTDCSQKCPDGTFGSFCTSCGTRHCQGESDCPADGTCSQGCQDGYIGHSCMQTNTDNKDPANSSGSVRVISIVCGTLLVVLLFVAAILFALIRQGKLQCVIPGIVPANIRQMDNMAVQTPVDVPNQPDQLYHQSANVSYQTVEIYHQQANVPNQQVEVYHQPADVSEQANTYCTIYDVLHPATRACAKDYDAIEPKTYQNFSNR